MGTDKKLGLACIKEKDPKVIQQIIDEAKEMGLINYLKKVGLNAWGTLYKKLSIELKTAVITQLQSELGLISQPAPTQPKIEEQSSSPINRPGF